MFNRSVLARGALLAAFFVVGWASTASADPGGGGGCPYDPIGEASEINEAMTECGGGAHCFIVVRNPFSCGWSHLCRPGDGCTIEDEGP